MRFSVRTRGLEPFKEYIDGLARNVRGIATEAIANDLLGNGTRGLRHYPPYRYITRSSVYRPPFKSDKQRRFVMAAIREGRITPEYPRRTGNYQRSWAVEWSRTNARITGELPHKGWPNLLARRMHKVNFDLLMARQRIYLAEEKIAMDRYREKMEVKVR